MILTAKRFMAVSLNKKIDNLFAGNFEL